MTVYWACLAALMQNCYQALILTSCTNNMFCVQKYAVCAVGDKSRVLGVYTWVSGGNGGEYFVEVSRLISLVSGSMVE